MTAKRLRVLHVLGELRPSGAETMLLCAARAFASHGVVSDIVATGATIGPFAPQLGAAGYGLRHLPFAKSPAFMLRFLRLARRGYDVVHLHTERANFWFGLAALASAPVVVRTIHGSFAFSGALRVRRAVQRRVLARLGVRQVAVGASARATEVDRFGVTPVLVPNWYDSDRFTPPDPRDRERARDALGLPPDTFVVATVGNCAPVKNHAAFIEALASFPPASRPLWLHVGVEQEGHPERSLAAHLGVSDRIRFLGHSPDVPRVLFAADAFAMPSLREGFGIAAVEALAVGLPVVATDVPGLTDFKDEFRGIFWARPTAESIAEALRKLMALSPDERSAIARDHATTARERYGIAAGVARYLEVYGNE